MKRFLAIVLSLIMTACFAGCNKAINNQFPNDLVVSTETEHPMITQSPEWPVYNTAAEIVTASSNIYTGKVKNISFEIVNMKTGTADSSAASGKTDCMLYTVYTVDVLKSYKGDNSGEIKICVIGGIAVDFLNPLEFYYEMAGTDMLTKIVAFFVEVEASNNVEKKIRKKTYWMADDGYCWVHEVMYNGLGVQLEELVPARSTLFEYIPAVVILNDGLTNDIRGESEIEDYAKYEKYYSKLVNSDFDAERKSMNPVRYTINASPESTENLSIGPGAFWDIQSDNNGVEVLNASVGQMESNMSYSTALSATLDRVDNEMHSLGSIPNIESDKLQGVITSGKTLKALYWPLIVRCDEKMQTWGAAAEFIAKCILDGASLYPKVVPYYTNEELPIVEADIQVMNNYALPEDEQDEKNIDLAEVTAQTMSRSSYMKKWRKLTDKEVMSELQQIALEQEMLSGNSYGNIPPMERDDQQLEGEDDNGKLDEPDVAEGSQDDE